MTRRYCKRCQHILEKDEDLCKTCILAEMNATLSVNPKILRNSFQCLKCGDNVESKYRHDYRMCSCQNLFVDGGKSYRRFGGPCLKDNSYEDTSEFDVDMGGLR